MRGSSNSKTRELQKELRELGRHLDNGDSSELVVWVIYSVLACAHRPLRHHPTFGGSGRDLPPDAVEEVRRWVSRIWEHGFRSIICLMHPKELKHYAQLDLGTPNLIEFYRQTGFDVRHIPWDDPAHRLPAERGLFSEELARVQESAFEAFNMLPKPVLLHCSAGIDRSSPVAAFIFEMNSREGQIFKEII